MIKLNTNVKKKMNNKKLRSKLLLAIGALTTISLLNYNNIALATNPFNIIQSGYLYDDSDIRTVLKTRLADNAYIAPALPSGRQDLLIEIIRASINEARVIGTSLVPININNNHWGALAIKRTNAGVIKIVYNDSIGTPMSATLAQALRNIDPTIQIIDLRVHQQSDGSSCGAFAAENLIKIAELDISNLSDDEIRAIIGKINNASLIRNSHFSLLYEGQEIFDTELLKPKSEKTVQEIGNQTKQLTNAISNINNFTHNRISNLDRLPRSAAAAGNDDITQHGLWVQSFVGTNSDKSNVGSGNLKTSSTSNSSLYGFILGADTKISEDITIGLAFSNINSNTKQKLQNILTSKDKISSNILTVYGSGNINDDILLSGNISYGKSIIKTTDQIANRQASKQKGDLLSSSLSADYTLYANESVTILPRLGLSYSSLALKARQDGSIKIPKIKLHELALNTGIAASTVYNTSSFAVVPEISVNYEHSVWHKGNKIKVSNLLNQTIITQNISNNKGAFKLGGSLTIEANTLEIGGGYEHTIQGKNRGHLGYAKLRINF